MGGAVRRGSGDADAIPPEVTPPLPRQEGRRNVAAVRRTGAFPGRLTPLYHLRTWLLPDCTGRVDFRPFGVLTFDTPNAYINLIRHAAASVRRRVFEAPH